MNKPQSQTKFLSLADERNHVSDCVQYFLAHENGHSDEAASYVRRLEELLLQAGTDDGSIMLQDHWALLHEARGEPGKAIEYREHEIELIEQLFAIEGPIGPINHAFMAEKMRLLAHDYSQVKEHDKAREIQQRVDGMTS